MKSKKSNIIFLLFLFLTFVSSKSAFAGNFANQFIEFQLPPQWQCNLEGAEWVCQNTNEAKKRDAIIVLAAKLKGDQDSLDQYLTYLKAAKTYTSVQGKPVKSEPKYAENKNVGGHPWVDALHLESEIPGFYTRYLATIQQDIGVLVTYSINKSKYQEYQTEFENMVRTLKVFRKAGGINGGVTSNIFSQTQIPANAVGDATIFGSGGQSIQGGTSSGGPRSPSQKLPLPLLLVAVGVVGFIIWRRRQNNS